MKNIFILVLMIIAGISTAKAQEFDQPFHNFGLLNLKEADGKIYLSTFGCGVWVSDKGKDNWQLHKESEWGGLFGDTYWQDIRKIKNRIVVPLRYVSLDSGNTWIKTNAFTSIQYTENRNYCSLIGNYSSIKDLLFSSKDDLDSLLLGDTLNLHLDTIKLPEGKLSWFRAVGYGESIFVCMSTDSSRFYVSTNIGKDWSLMPYPSTVTAYTNFAFFENTVIYFYNHKIWTFDNSGKLLDSISLDSNSITKDLYLYKIINFEENPILCFHTVDEKGLVDNDTAYYFTTTDFGRTLTPFATDLPIDFSLRCIERVDSSIYYIGNHFLYKSTDNGITKKSLTTGLHASNNEYFVNDSYIISESNNKHYLLKSLDKGKTWFQSGKGLDSYFYRFQSNKNILYGFTESGYFKSIDSGETFTKTSERNGHFSAFSWLVTDSCFIYKGENKVEISYNEGKTWDTLKQFYRPSEVITANNAIIVYENDSLFVSTDNARSFVFVNKISIMRLCFFENTLYARKRIEWDYREFMKSTDLGKTWQFMDSTLTADVENFIIKENLIIGKNSQGYVRISKDYGKTWVTAKSKRSTSDSKLIINQNTLYCGIYYHGLLSLDLTPLLNSSGVENDLVLMPNKVNVYPNPTTDFINYTINLETEANVEAEIYSISGKLLLTDSKGILTQGKHSLFSMVNELPSGQYLMNIKIGDKTINSKFEIVR